MADAHRLRRADRGNLRRGRDPGAAGRGFRRERGVRLRHDDPGHHRRSHPADRRRGARDEAVDGGGGPAVRLLPGVTGRRAAGLRPVHEGGGRARREAGGRHAGRAPRGGARRRRHPCDGAPRAHPAVRARVRRVPGAGPRRGRRPAAARREGPGGGRRVRRGARGHPVTARRADHRGAARPDDRHRRRPGLRRAGPGLAGHGRAVAALPKFAKRYADIAAVLRTAASEFAADVASGAFPTEEYSYR